MGWKTLCLGQKNSEKNISFPWKNCFFSLRLKKKTFFLREQKFASEFFCPWHNVSSQKEHILFRSLEKEQDKYILMGFRLSLVFLGNRWHYLRALRQKQKINNSFSHYGSEFSNFVQKLGMLPYPLQRLTYFLFANYGCFGFRTDKGYTTGCLNMLCQTSNTY